MSDISESIAALNIRLLEAGIGGSEVVDRGNNTFRIEITHVRDAKLLKALTKWEELDLFSFDLGQGKATFTVTFQ